MARPRFLRPPHREHLGLELVRDGKALSLAIHVGHVPRRKRKALYVRDGSVSFTCAYFRSDKEADRFMAVLQAMLSETGAMSD